MRLQLPANGLSYCSVGKNTFRRFCVSPNHREQKMLGLNGDAAKLTGLIAGKKVNSPRSFRQSRERESLIHDAQFTALFCRMGSCGSLGP